MNDQPLILNFTDDAKITDAVTPQPCEFAAQRFAEMTRIARSLKPRLQPVEDARCGRSVEFCKLLLREPRNLNLPGQATS